MQIRPQHPTVNVLDNLQQMVMITPIDSHEDEAKSVAEKYESERDQRSPGGVMRNFDLQHHDGDDDRNYPVTESFQPVFSHLSNRPLVSIENGARISCRHLA